MNLNSIQFTINPATSTDEEANCIGSFYRYRESAYRTRSGGYALTQTLTKLKRISCKGCNWCVGTDECIENEWSNSHAFPVILPDGTESGDIIAPYIVTVSTDWETGYPDDCEIHANIVEPKQLVTGDCV
jgi:hypothetical protein